MLISFITEFIIKFSRVVSGHTFFIVIRLIFITFNIFLVVATVLLWKRVKAFTPSFFLSKSHHWRLSLQGEELEARWKAILAKALSAPPQSYTLAIIEADTFVDTLLKRLGFQGEHMADRLEELEEEDLETLDRLRRAHRIRNHLVHTPDFDLPLSDAQEVLEVYQKFLEEIGALPSKT